MEFSRVPEPQMTAPFADLLGFPKAGSAARSTIAEFRGEPDRELFSFVRIRVSGVVDVADFVDQNIVQIEVPNRFPGPGEFPLVTILSPFRSKHPSFDQLVWFGRETIRLDEAFFDRIQVNIRAPLHPIQRKETSFSGHSAQLNYFNPTRERIRQFGQTTPYIINRYGMKVALPSRFFDELDR